MELSPKLTETPTDDSLFTLDLPDVSMDGSRSSPESKSDKDKSSESKKASYVIPKHVKRALDCVQSILEFPDAFRVGYLIEARVSDSTWEVAEIMNVQCDRMNYLWYYIHFFGRPKREDSWIRPVDLRPISEIDSLRSQVPKTFTISSTQPQVMQQGSVWPGFFQLSQLTKQTTPGSSPYGSSSSGSHHDPYEYSPKTIPGIEFGPLRIKAWYRSPYPLEYWSPNQFLRVCERCLSYGLSQEVKHECPRDLGGPTVYSKDDLVIREIDGGEGTGFCERLFLLAKLFLEDKRTSQDEVSQISQVTPFLFYALFENERFVGYFSKYKIQKRDSPILSCIMVLPSEQRKGFGKLLISFAYELSKREGRQGSAERPLSGPGLAAFMSWWTWRLRTVVEQCYDGEQLTIAQISDLSGMTSEDVVETLRNCGALKQWGPPGSSSDIKLRESGKRTRIKMTMDMMRALESKCPRDRTWPNEFDPSRLSDHVRLCPMIGTSTPKAFP